MTRPADLSTWVLICLSSALIAMALTGCTRTTTPAPAAPTTTAVRHLGTANPTPIRNRFRDATPVPSPTFIGRSACDGPGAPPAAALPLDAAERDVLRWSPPRAAARVEWSRYALSSQILALGRRWPREWKLDGDLALLDPASLEQSETGARCRLLAIVLAHASGIPIYDLSRDAKRPGGSWLFPGGDRQPDPVVALFDAQTGAFMGALEATYARADIDALIRGLEALPTTEPERAATTVEAGRYDQASLVTSEHPETTAWPTRMPPSSAATPLPVGGVPASLLPVAADIPFVAGSLWTYQVTSITNGLFWETRVVTRTIDAAAMLDASTMAFHFTARTPSDDDWHTLAADGVRDEQGDGLDLAWPFTDVPVGSRLTANEFDTNDTARGTVTVPVGTFEACHGLHRRLGQCMSTSGWFCPGVGWVWREDSGCTSLWDNVTVYELIDYDIPALTAIEP